MPTDTENLPAAPESAAEELTLAKQYHHKATGPLACLLDTDLFNHLWRVAKGYSRSTLVPEQFRGKEDDCFIAVQLSLRLGVDPFMLMQNMYVVHGKPGMEAKLAIALCNARGRFRDLIQWKFTGEGESRACTAYAHDKLTGGLCETTITWATVKAEGWLGKTGSKWKTMPDQMFKYRTASWLIKTYCPEVLMGLQTTDELRDIVVDAESSDADVPFRKALPSTTVEEMLEAADLPQDAPPAPAADTKPPDSKPGTAPEPDTEDEAEAVDRFIWDVRGLDTLTALAEARKLIDAGWSEKHRHDAGSAIEVQVAEVRRKQAGKPGQRQLLDSGPGDV